MISASIKTTPVHIGDTVRIHNEIVEGTRTRVQVFEGILIRLKGRGENRTFTVRKIGAASVGIERTWPMDAKSIVKVEVKKHAINVRRSKLYYLRELKGKSAVRV